MIHVGLRHTGIGPHWSESGAVLPPAALAFFRAGTYNGNCSCLTKNKFSSLRHCIFAYTTEHEVEQEYKRRPRTVDQRSDVCGSLFSDFSFLHFRLEIRVQV
ncbi:hypothetical protein C0J52_14387 [Blattella germanica]|nr:hypothetical protein C0J52_14387 [Blattella germanica]